MHVYMVHEAKSCKRITVKSKSCKKLKILQDCNLPCKKVQVLARVQNFLQDFDFKNLAYQDIFKILQVLQDLAANLQDLATNLQDGFYWDLPCASW